MSNVEYKCPTRHETGCGARLFAAPGGTATKCHYHDVVYEQVEEYLGATFEYIEDATGRSRKGTATHLRTDRRPENFKNIKDVPNVNVVVKETPQQIMARLRARYEQLYHKKVDKRWRENKLRELVGKKEDELEAASSVKSAELKAMSDEIDRLREEAGKK